MIGQNISFRVRVLLLVVISSISLSLNAQIEGLKYGKLDNGLSYYIMKDKNFKNEAHFFLYQNVGAILENDEQNGLAHYLEHMAFNSTEHFPNGVMNFLRKNGLYGFDAHTGTNETQYAVYGVPVNNKPLTDSVLLVLKDWCNGLSLTEKDMEKERNIVIEEWRQRDNVDKRLTDAIATPIYNSSKYSYRNTIGNEKLLKKFKVKDIREFYDSWYKPNLQCVAIIGDIDPNVYEKKVKELFGKIPTPKKKKEREPILIKENVKPLYYRFVDAENTNNSFGIYQRVQLNTNLTQEDKIKLRLFEMIFNKLSSRRLGMIKNEGVEDFIGASVSYSSLVRMYAQNAWDVVPYEGAERKALKQILSVRESIRRLGFSEQEFEKAKEEIYENLKGVLGSKNLGTPDNYMEVFKQNYLYKNPLQTFRERLTDLVESLVELEVEDMNKWIVSWMNDKNLAFITYSSKAEDMNISLAEFEKILAEVKNAPLMKISQPKPIKQLIDFDIKPGKIVSEKMISEIETEEWKLSNGAKLLYKYIPNMREGIFFVGSAMGGRSLVKNEDLPSYRAMESLVMKSGVHNYNRNQLYNWMQDKELELTLNVTDYTDGLGGNASLKNAEDFFKYLYLVLNHQNFKEDIFKKYVEREKYLYKTRNVVGMAAAQDSIREVLFPYTEANPKEDLSFYNNMKHSRLLPLFNDRFGNAADFTFCLIGALKKEEAKVLVEKYIASLSGNPSLPKRTYKIIDNSAKEKEITREFLVDVKGNVGEVELSYSNDKALSEKEQKAMAILEGVLQNRFFTELREKSGGTYSVGVKANYNPIPEPSISLSIHFSTETNKVDKLKKQAYQILNDVAKGKFSEDEFKNVYVQKVLDEKQAEMMTKGAGNDTDNPFQWLAILNAYAEKGELPNKNKEKVKSESITFNDVVAVLNKILDNAKHRDIVIKSIPEEKREWKH
ncbi:MAG: insulinase family protein [Flavobacteriaceae bacterium]|nr:insulinase family protein [Flavobacteriaceae bacterium]